MSLSVGVGLGGGREVVEQVLVGHLAEQRAPVVDQHDLRLLRRARAHDLVDVRPQQRRSCPTGRRRRSAGAARRRRRGRSGASSFSLMPSRSRRSGDLAAHGVLADRVERDLPGQQPQLRALRALPGGGHPVDQVVDAVAEGVGVCRRRRCAGARRGSAAWTAPGRGPGGRPAPGRRPCGRPRSRAGRRGAARAWMPKTSRIAAR